MRIEIIAAYDNFDKYIIEMEKDPTKYNELWDKYAIEPYWDKISQWARVDMSERKPKPITDVSKLREQMKILKEIDLELIREKFIQVLDALPNYDDDPIVVALYPVDDNNLVVKERQNGVWGVNVFGNIILNINPLVEDYLDWIPYVFAHEYHHSVWGNYWYVINGGFTRSLLESLLIDGQADSFAKSLYPNLNPSWVSEIAEEKERQLWNEHYSKLLYETEFDYTKYMFGNKEAGIPWCTGYYFGYKIINQFIKNNPETSFKNLIELSPKDILSMSKYSL